MGSRATGPSDPWAPFGPSARPNELPPRRVRAVGVVGLVAGEVVEVAVDGVGEVRLGSVRASHGVVVDDALVVGLFDR